MEGEAGDVRLRRDKQEVRDLRWGWEGWMRQFEVKTKECSFVFSKYYSMPSQAQGSEGTNMKQTQYLPSRNSACCWGAGGRHRQLQFGGIDAILGGTEGHGNFLEKLELELSFFFN